MTDAVNLPTFTESENQSENVAGQRNVIEEHKHFIAQHALSHTPRIKLLVDIVSLVNLTELILLVSGSVLSFKILLTRLDQVFFEGHAFLF